MARRKANTKDGGQAPGASPLAIVGLGVSANNLNSAERLFVHLPREARLAYVVALRSSDGLSPDRVAEALAAQSGLPAEIATDGRRLEPDHIYVGGADDKLTFLDGHLQVARAEQAPGDRGTLDTMLVSLAEQNGDRAIAVILDGMGSDGVLGVATLKEQGGMSLAEPAGDEADVAASPQGLVDFVLPVETMPQRVCTYARYLADRDNSSEMDALKAQAEDHLPRIATLLRNRTGHDFHGYKPNTFLRRVQRRMHVTQSTSIDAYIERLGAEPAELDNLFQDLLIGVTQFFRDKPEFERLAREVIPKIFEGKTVDDQVRIWVLGCASGEEAYSLAILLREHMAELGAVPQVQIFATDIDARALALARAGRYPDTIARDVEPERLARWFVREGNTFAIHKDLREMCIFSAHNVIKDAPFSRIDLISCRNLLIYLNTDLQERVIPLFHFSLKPGGHLFLGPSENVTRHPRLFQPIDRKHRIFRRLETAVRVLPEFPLGARTQTAALARDSAGARPRHAPDALNRQAERVAERHAPAYVVIDAEYDVLNFSGRTGLYLEPAAGAASLNLLNLVHRDLRPDLRAGLHQARDTQRAVKLERLTIAAARDPRRVNIIIEPVGAADAAPHFVVLFQDLGAADAAEAGPPEGHVRDEHLQRLEADLRLAKERLQTTIEELESTNEELKSSNEEYQSINEEMQSANEELETSKEELQSVNEELQTVNGELAHRVNELAKTNSDLKNLLQSTQIATVFLDNELRVRNFTPAATEVFHLLETDVGRPINHVVPTVAYPELLRDVHQVLRTLGRVEREVESPETGSRYLARVLPYRSLDNFIAGVVLTFLDITATARAEQALRESEARNRLMLESATDYAIIAMDAEARITGWNPGAREILGWHEDEVLGRSADMIFTPEDRDAGAPVMERRAADSKGRAADQRWHVRKDGGRFWSHGMLTPMRGALSGYLKILRDATAERRAEERQRLLLGELQHRVRNILGVVRSLAARTAETSASVAEFASHLDGRLATLARTQNIFARTGDVIVDLEEMVRDELVSLCAPDAEQVDVSGPEVRLRQSAAETFALALHELATNAVKYGALSGPKGRVTVHWRVFNTSAGARLSLEWRETGVTALDMHPTRSGFGRELIERGLPFELGAATSLSFEPGGVRALIEVPLTEHNAVLDPPEQALGG